MRRGFADLPLHGGKAPKWLFDRMVKLSREISLSIIYLYGTQELLNRLSDPFWFQAFGCVLGFDWHSSGVTTTVTGALKEGLKDEEKNIGIFFAGGKGKRAVKTPEDINIWIDKGYINFEKGELLKKYSRLVAKVDTVGLQDNFSIYHHFFIYSKDGIWAVIEQGMNEEKRIARRYHWFSKEINSFVSDPHKGIASDLIVKPLNLVDSKIEKTRNEILTVSTEIKEDEAIKILDKRRVNFPFHHPIFYEDYEEKRLKKLMSKIKDYKPKSFEDLILIEGLGEKTMRALALISHLIFGSELSFKDPVTFSFAHGGKDGHPYPVDRKTYDISIEILKNAVEKAKLGDLEKIKILKNLSKF
ncbi:MAG: DUF763 domain-containing protein [Caldisericia bacterium]|nr:DUF763 domain-containing protein [Caldisericia bacterium]